MHIDQHDLVHEFPEHRERIHELKVNDRHFAELFRQYHQIDHDIVRIEDGVEHRSDAELETLKKQRLQLKDQLYARLIEGG